MDQQISPNPEVRKDGGIQCGDAPNVERKKERKALFGKLLGHFLKWKKLQKLVLCLGLSREDELKVA